MSKLVWDKIGEKSYETGVDRGVLFVQSPDGGYKAGVAWSGLRSVNENPDGADPTDLYADNIKYGTMRSAENFKATISAYMSPEEFDECDGTAELVPGISVGQQERTPFAMAYRTRVESDSSKGGKDYKYHIIYNAIASPSERNYETVNDSPSALELSWDIETTPIEVDGLNPTAHITIDSRKVSAKALKAIEDALYGTESTESKLLMPNEFKVLVQQLLDSEKNVVVDSAEQALNTSNL